MNNIEKIAASSLFIAMLVAQKYLFSFLPNISFTMLLIFVSAKILGVSYGLLTVNLFVLIDNLILGTLAPFVLLPMVFTYSLVVIVIGSIFRKNNSSVIMALLGGLFSLIYSWSFAVSSIITFDITLWVYLVADIPFEVVLCTSNIVVILWLYEPIIKALHEHGKIGELYEV